MTKVRGLDRFFRRLRKYDAITIANVQRVTESGLLEIETTAKRSIKRGSKSGILYQKYKPRRQHQASSPGEAPADDTGDLANSINRITDSDGMGGEVEAASDHAKVMEFGSRTIEPRPFLQPAMEEHRSTIQRAYRNAVKKASRQTSKS